MALQAAKIRKILKKIGKIRKSWSMTKKKVIRHFGRENGNSFLKKTAFRNLARRNVLLVPQTRRQVSAYDEKLFIGFRITDLKVPTVTLTTVAYQRLPCVYL